MITLKLLKPSWINGSKDDPNDQCAHGYIDFKIDDLIIAEPNEEWTVSAAALFSIKDTRT